MKSIMPTVYANNTAKFFSGYHNPRNTSNNVRYAYEVEKAFLASKANCKHTVRRSSTL